ncbi:MAG: beta-ketoacyl synthase chain length factor [Puia sp.]|nr:beta-ketoacyl synthase chain length factor [Puia sp.]
MSVYIRATACISPQKTFGSVPFLTAPVAYTGNRLGCVEPDYRDLIDGRLMRRMSRIIKMGVAAASWCLREACAVSSPDAIVTGTAFGCLEDTGVFLSRLIDQQEEMLSPTAFIQSTHNTVGGQIALMLQCHRYNNTFVHRGFSFESALLDGLLLLEENEASNVLVGGLDEITDTSHAIMTRFGLYRRLPVSNFELFAADSKGTLAGEGAAFFLLTNRPSANDYARLEGVTTFYKPADVPAIENRILSFLGSHSIGTGDIDLVITGQNGDEKGDTVYRQLQGTVFKDKVLAPYKHLCGEYPTSTSFALWLAANILKTGTVPEVIDSGGRYLDRRDSGNPGERQNKRRVRRILVYNHHQQVHHSLLLISAMEG